MRSARYRIIAIVLLFSVLSCHRLVPSVGKARDVVVVSSIPDTALIVENIQRYRYVPQREPTFVFIFTPDTMLKNLKQFHSLFLYGSLKDDFIYELLNPEAREATLRDTFNLFKMENLWAKHQTVVILAVSEPDYTPAGIRKYRDMISRILEESCYRTVKRSFYEKDMDKKIKAQLAKFGWEMDVPAGWIIDTTYKTENFVFVHTHYPDRSVFLYKEKISSALSDSMVIKKRNELTKKYYNGDYVFSELTKVESIEFKGMKGLRVNGVWQNDSLVAGGPFLSYFLTRGDSLFVIDGILFLPGERKTDYIMGLEVMMNSFRIVE